MGLVELQEKIAVRIAHGGSLSQVAREIIDPAALPEEQRSALWLYAASQPEVRREAKPYVHESRPAVRS